jgi:hypothetical protein
VDRDSFTLFFFPASYMRRTYLAALLIAAAASVTVAPPAAMAADRETEATSVSEKDRENARSEFAEGNTAFQKKQWGDALKAFERSYSIVSSPNTELMIARCLRELGRRADAANRYANAAQEAKQRVTKGEAKYKPTADAATTEGNALRGELGTIKVKVVRPSGASATVTANGSPITLSKEGEAQVLHETGAVSVIVTDGSGVEQKRTITVSKGATTDLEFSVRAPKSENPTPPTPPTDPDPPPTNPDNNNNGAFGEVKVHTGSEATWAKPAAIVTGSLTVAALGLFIGFGLSSQSQFDELYAKCGRPPRCTEEDRASADSGAQAQTIANVGLVAAGVLAVTTIVLVLIARKAATDSKPATTTAPTPASSRKKTESMLDTIRPSGQPLAPAIMTW